MSAPSTPPPVTLSRFGAPCDALDAGLVPERPEPHARDVRGMYLSDREKWLTRHLTRAMAPRIEWTPADLDKGEPGWPVKVEGCGSYPVLAAVCGVNGIAPPSRERMFIREIWQYATEGITALLATPEIRVLAAFDAAEQEGELAAMRIKRDQVANPRNHRGEPSAAARALAWLA